MTNDEINQLADLLHGKFGNAVGLDREFIAKCLTGISNLGDEEVEAKIKQLFKLK